MLKDTQHIKFHNQQNPHAGLDILQLENLLVRQNLDHSPLDLHLVEFYMIILITEGSGSHTIDFTEYHYQAGTLLTIRKDQIHRFHQNTTAKGVLILFTDDFLVSYLEKLEALKSLQLFNEILGTPKFQLSEVQMTEVINLIERIKSEYFQTNDDYSLGIIRSELHILIAKLFRIKAQSTPSIQGRKYLSQFIAFQQLVEVQAHRHLKVKEYASELGISTKTLNNITKSIVNRSAKEFIDDISIKQIKRLLINTDYSIKEIAHQSGFDERSNFHNYFKKLMHITPEQFRASF